ncbi:MAG: transglycosylase domain-containing protein [Microbacterium sp.]|uniref:transglycosylase domain-containing protein n=1 Tax=Microbacterium sp. TaxID=51671 RepID=UPI0039E67455
MPESKRTATGVLGGFAGLVGLSAVAGLLVTATVTPAIALTSNAATSAINLFEKLPSYLDIDELMLPTTLYYTNSKTKKPVVLTQFYDQNRSPVKFDEIAPVMFDAILSSEDPRFYEHGGIDMIGTARALMQNLRGNGETQGGSSISQQYVKNVLVQKCEWNAKTEEEGEECWLKATTASGSEGYERKLQEMRYAISLEQRYSKNEILLGYLNIANFGGTNYGIDAAAKYYFGVSAGKLSLAQAATLAGMVQNPNNYRIDRPKGSFYHATTDTVTNSKEDGYADAKVRRNYVLDRMLEEGKITKEQHDEAKAEPIKPNITEPKTGCAKSAAPYFCQYVRSIIANDTTFGATAEDRQKALKQGGLKVYTSLDMRLQEKTTKVMKKYTPAKKKITGSKPGWFGSAAVSIEADSGRILSIGQNTKFSEDKSETKKNRAYSSLVYAGDSEYGQSNGFPSGSTFKLFTLIDWLEQGYSLNEVLNGTVRLRSHFTNSCDGDWVPTSSEDFKPVANSGGAAGAVSTPLVFTSRSLNSGYVAMAERLDLCDIKKVATRLGVERADGSGEVTMTGPFSILGTNNVSPIAMAGAYSAVANKGVLCTPRAIDRVTDSEGNDLPMPEHKCKQVLDPGVAATAAYALRAVMTGGTGVPGNPGGSVPVIGKTGTHNKTQKWLIESSTKVTTAVWAGNERGEGDITYNGYKGIAIQNMPFYMNKAIQGKANDLYGGKSFPSPDSKLTRVVYTNLPNVVGMSVDQAKRTLQSAGFQVNVGPSVDSSETKGLVARQTPSAGKVAGGMTVTINPSNGQGVSVPDVSGLSYQQATARLHGEGFGNVRSGSCREDRSVRAGELLATGTSPAAGKTANRNTTISINVRARSCP